jgi:tetratricopeptide (TPR) repeat protein
VLTDPTALSASAHAALLKTIYDLMNQGREAEAEARLAALHPEVLQDPQMRRYVAILWNNLGVMKWSARGAAAGIPAFKTAVSLDPSNKKARVNLVHAYWELKDPALTREFLEQTVAAAPEEPLPHLALADLLYDKDDLAGASLHLDLAAQRVAQDPDLRGFLEFVTAKVKRAEKAEQKFSARGSSHFTVKFDGGEDYAVWDRVLDVLEEAYRDIGQRFGYFPAKSMTVVLHARGTFQNATGSPAWADGLFDGVLGRIQIPTQGALTDQAWLTRVLRHEYVHALLHDRMGGRFGAVPTWLNEGLAMQLAGDPWPDLDQVVRGDIKLIPLNHLEGSWGGFPPQVATVAYLEANSATLYLIERFGMQRTREIVDRLASGQPIAVAMQDRLFIPYEQFQNQWVENLNDKLRSGKT